MTYTCVSMCVEGKRAILNVSSVLHLFYYSSSSVLGVQLHLFYYSSSSVVGVQLHLFYYSFMSIVGVQLHMFYYSSTSVVCLQLTTCFETTQVDPELSATPSDLGFAVIIQL